MSYLSMMTNDEIRYVCSVIPLQEVVGYFKQYPKYFAKVMPGFRATSLRNQEKSNVLFKSLNQPFISSFIEKDISRWLEKIQREILLITDKGESKENAWLKTLPSCFFADNIRIFFKLTGEEQSEEYISLLSQSIRQIKSLVVESKKLNETISNKEQEQFRLRDKIECIQNDLDKSGKKLIELTSEIKVLKRTNADLEKLVEVVCAKEQGIKELEKNVQERDETIRQLKADLSTTLNEQQELEIRIREELKKQKAAKLIKQVASTKPIRPKDIDEFRDFLGYNLENLGIETSAEYYSLLKDHLCEILFTGKPIIVSRNTGLTLMKCVSNTIVSSDNVPTLVFASDISTEAIDEFLSTKNRIMCLDNFIGYFDEAILTTICDRHKDKIVFLTVAYDRTLRYVPAEFLKYCHYLNINRIEIFTQWRDLTEDPSAIEEIEALDSVITPDAICASFLKEIFDEFGMHIELSTYKSSLASDEESLCRLLTFDILPYCADVLDVSPFNVSERLNKYVSDRCRYKELFRRWFS